MRGEERRETGKQPKICVLREVFVKFFKCLLYSNSSTVYKFHDSLCFVTGAAFVIDKNIMNIYGLTIPVIFALSL